MAILVQSGDPGREETPPRLRENLRRRPQRAAAATEFARTLDMLDVTQLRIARLFGTTPRTIRRWRDGTRRTQRGVDIVLRLLAAGAITVAQVEEAAADPAPARANGGGAKGEPPAPRHAAPAPEQPPLPTQARPPASSNRSVRLPRRPAAGRSATLGTAISASAAVQLSRRRTAHAI